ncbi:UNVERIFIED_CONTAM: hypothetical protein NCL1_39733 [Trichonephila clavipes]
MTGVQKILEERAVCKMTCCWNPSRFCEQESPFKMVPRSYRENKGPTTYPPMSKSRPLWKRRLNSLGRYQVGYGGTRLYFFERGIVTAERHRDEVLKPYVRLCRGTVGSGFNLMDGNTRPHRAYLIDEFLKSEDINWMDWPVRSPDRIPIEHA